MTGTRIRWEPADYGNIGGYAGTLERPLFKISRPVLARQQWVLTTTLPGWLDEVKAGTPDLLKKAAEAWLAEFAASIGAVFSDAPVWKG